MSEKIKDEKNRWRNKTIAFRLSPEENEELEKRYRLLGYRTKQDYLIDSVLKNKVIAMGNMQMIYQFKRSLEEILSELQRIDKSEEMGEELMTPIRTMLEIMEAIKNQDDPKNEEVQMPEQQYGQMMHLRKLRELLSQETEDETNE
ncbi:plasmid mobilization protein [Lachnospira multipara]|uniref:plasmid mobilization protein n=1 Tax=Lachnospira multipara TaxID=28051 RepID=UPI000B1BA529|nr:hypothetical protein [Lachnospira multipara]